MPGGMQALGVAVGVTSWCLLSSSTGSRAWRVHGQADPLGGGQHHYEGLWMSCVATATGSFQCNRFPTILGLPGPVVASRGLMVCSMLLGLVALPLAILGLRCVRVGPATDQAKARLALIGGSLLILSGLGSLIAVSWYASRVIEDFHSHSYAGLRFELGTGLYLGWAASVLSLLAGALIAASCRSDTAPSLRRSTLQVYTAAPVCHTDNHKAYV